MEGPALTLLKEEAELFIGQRITAAAGSSKIDMDLLIDQRLNKLQSCGKHFLMVLDNCTIRIHYLMFGNYYLNSRHAEKNLNFLSTLLMAASGTITTAPCAFCLKLT
ncbi:MAG: hypothetical protein WKG06_17855 [Segetibacter sp.]